MFPAARVCIESLYQSHAQGEYIEVTDVPFDGLFVKRGPDYFQLVKYLPFDGSPLAEDGMWRPGSHQEQFDLPDSAIVVVRPDALRHLLADLAGIARPQDVSNESDLSTRERDTLLRILFGVACAAPYSFNPSANRSEASTLIATATDAAGCSVHPDTVRTYLKEAASKFGVVKKVVR